jgi:hypothetical protein
MFRSLFIGSEREASMRKFLAAASMVRVPRMIMLTLSVIAAISATPLES